MVFNLIHSLEICLKFIMKAHDVCENFEGYVPNFEINCISMNLRSSFRVMM